MKAKSYLLKARRADYIIQHRLEEINRWRDMAEHITANFDAVPSGSGGNHSKTETAVINIVDITRELQTEVAEQLATRAEIIKTIEQLPINEFNVLYNVYISGKDFQTVADQFARSRSWVTSINGIALKHLQEILDERTGTE